MFKPAEYYKNKKKYSYKPVKIDILLFFSKSEFQPPGKITDCFRGKNCRIDLRSILMLMNLKGEKANFGISAENSSLIQRIPVKLRIPVMFPQGPGKSVITGKIFTGRKIKVFMILRIKHGINGL